MIRRSVFLFIAFLTINTCFAQESLQKLYPVSYSQVEITDNFWKPRMQTVATATLAACIDYTENKTGRIRNFEKAARHKGEKHEGVYYDDSDVYKALEAMGYSLKNHPDNMLENKADEWIDKIAAAQLPDGYLNTYYELTGLQNRWTDMEKHEDYCAGHLIEAAIAYYNSTGKRKLLDVAIRFANHIDSTFRLSNRHWVSGHQEIELALMKLYHLTKDSRYLKLAQWYLEQRGHNYGKGKIWDDWKDPDYCQDGKPVKDQTEITGHAVRAMYLYTGAADVAAVTNDQAYINAMKAVWEDVVFRNMYITGGIGAQGTNEGFGVDYDLPNETAYCETCASVGMVFWNQRMNMLTGDARFVDVLERSLYNGALDGLSLSGDRFFYGNPLASSGKQKRQAWFGTACCPSNIARLVASVGNYIYATSSDAIYVNLFIGSNTEVALGKNTVALSMTTGYPWNGHVQLAVNPSRRGEFKMKIRMPGWLDTPVEGGLYSYEKAGKQQPKISVNGKEVVFTNEDGYAVISRKWKKGDAIQVEFPMEVRRVVSRPEIKQNQGRVALQYGPIMYCLEGKDNGNKALNVIIPEQTNFTVDFQKDLLGGVNTIRFDGIKAAISADKKSIDTKTEQLTAIPYYSWNNRGPGEMLVWIPTSFTDVKVNY